MANVVIIGAGLTGLSTAYHLEKKSFYDYVIFEKEKEIGGLCRSIYQDGFTFDYTGHLLHAHDPYVQSLIDTVIGHENLNAIIRRSFIYSQETFTHYPYQMHLHGLPEKTIIECISSFIKRKRSRKKKHSFHTWVKHHFGTGFGHYFFFPYQKKIFDYDTRKLTAQWTHKFVPKTSLEQLLSGALHDSFKPDIGYNARFLYPQQGGIWSSVKKIASHLTNPIYTGFCVHTIDLKNKLVHFTNGHTEPFKHLINTMPLNTFLECLKEKSSTSLKHAIPKLQCNAVINFNLGIAHELSDKHWIYFPEKKYPFYRLGFPHNFAASMAPAHCSSLYGEFSYLNRSTRSVHQTLKNSLAITKKLFKLTDTSIVSECIIHIPHAYVIYDAWRDKYVPKILAQLEEHAVRSIGRYGAWKYASMQDAILDGKKAADIITIVPAKQIHSKKINITKQKEVAINNTV